MLLIGQAGHSEGLPEKRGSVVETTGPGASVVVLRGAQAYTLGAGDLLFDGDKVFTRSTGTARLRLELCELDLPEASFIEVDAAICLATPVVLEAGTSLEGISIGTSAQVGASPSLLPLLATGAAAAGAAAATNGDSPSPAIID